MRQRQQCGKAGYAPTVEHSTHLLPSGHIEIRNYNKDTSILAAGHATSVLQSFLTTKAASEGIGLALAHDIVVRDHRVTSLWTAAKTCICRIRPLLPASGV